MLLTAVAATCLRFSDNILYSSYIYYTYWVENTVIEQILPCDVNLVYTNTYTHTR